MKNWIVQNILAVLVLSLMGSVFGQSHSVRVDSVIIIGNKHTKNDVILREIPFHFPHQVTQQDLETIRKRLLNLHLFNNVDVRLHEGSRKNIIIITVTETWYFYPAPLIFFNERSLKKVSVGLQLIHMNFRGMNEKVLLSGWLGYNPGGQLSYLNPWLGHTQRFILSLKAQYRSFRNRSFPFQEKRRGISIGLGKRFTLYQYVYAQVDWRVVSVPDSYAVYMATATPEDRIISATLMYQNDHRDLFEFPLSGYYIEFRASHFGAGSSPLNFNRLVSDLRGYLPLVNRRLSLAVRNYTVLQEGFVPIYEWQYLGYEERLRGYFYTPMTDQNIMLSSAEFRYLIVPYRVKTLTDSGILAYFLKDIRFAVSLSAFLNGGLLWNAPQEFQLSRTRWGYGAGINFHLPFVQILRLEVARNDQGKSQFIIDVGISF